MKKFNIHFVENLKKYLIVSGCAILIGIIGLCVFGIDLDINFTGGSRFTYTYEGDLNLDEVKKVADKTLGVSTTVTGSASAVDAGSSKVVISFGKAITAKDIEKSANSSKADSSAAASSATSSAATASGSTESSSSSKDGIHTTLEKALQENFSKNKIAFAESNVIEATTAKGFYQKSLIAVVLSALLVIVYVGIRFRKIGGVSAAVFSFVALIHDVLIAFFACVLFRLPIDTNFIAVILTILGYSLNDTIIIYDRVRENRAKQKNDGLAGVVDLSINQTLTRSLLTSITTFLAVVVVAVVAEFYGLTSLRSFAIPMSLGMVSGSYSSICLAGPLWVRWQDFTKKRREAKEKKGKPAKKAKAGK